MMKLQEILSSKEIATESVAIPICDMEGCGKPAGDKRILLGGKYYRLCRNCWKKVEKSALKKNPVKVVGEKPLPLKSPSSFMLHGEDEGKRKKRPTKSELETRDGVLALRMALLAAGEGEGFRMWKGKKYLQRGKSLFEIEHPTIEVGRIDKRGRIYPLRTRKSATEMVVVRNPLDRKERKVPLLKRLEWYIVPDTLEIVCYQDKGKFIGPFQEEVDAETYLMRKKLRSNTTERDPESVKKEVRILESSLSMMRAEKRVRSNGKYAADPESILRLEELDQMIGETELRLEEIQN
jgi:hypothetical protein